ncbi:YopX family protein [Bacillus sp. AFS075034]|uniref:YopX family protein n=1 Tax=Bacillus sp. AFS075034 TaxID=2034281 RepID=UPI000BF6F66B|nr:YopX family protein [Bacillus sp. AFS075034]PFW61601.1 hypothetical protein COL20_16845 [Bacillus sp. AFS075034]
MREIKVRFWDEDNKRFWFGGGSIDNETFQTYFKDGGLTGAMLEDVSYGFKRVDDTWERELPCSQFTGLKDSKGNEIYEGDIVKVSGHPFEGLYDMDRNYEVEYNEYMEICCGSWYLVRMRPWAEVIGNKFENPELLKGADKE